MNYWKGIFIVLMLCLSPTISLAADLGFLRISLIDGDVQLKAEDSPEWFAGALNMPLRDGDRIWVPDGGRLELQLRNGSYVRLNEKTSLDILRVDRDASQFYVSTGQVYVNFIVQKGGLIQMDTPATSLRSYDRAKFRINVADDGYTEVSVFGGSLNAEGRGGRTTVTAGNVLYVGSDTYGELAALGPIDEWERWNTERDRRLSERRSGRTYSNTYLPGELRSYADDFDEYGRWVHTRDYGYVWTPTTAVSAGWAPYSVGRWVWVGDDYVWLSYEPWGWTPYHYGRWAFGASIGWYWVPPVVGAVYWGPGFVGWVSTPSYVAWVPLAPNETYYGYGYYGPHSVNVRNVTVNKTEITNVYKNVYVNNGVTVVNRQTFLTGKHAEGKITENPFLTQQTSIGRPQISPLRETRMPVVKEVPDIKLPPQRIRNVQINALKESRPLVTERNKSVMKPGSAQKEMSVRRLREAKTPTGSDAKGPLLERGRDTAPKSTDVQKRRGTDTRGTDVQRRPSPEMKQPDVERKGRTETRGTDIQRRPGTDVKPQDAEKRKGTDIKPPEAEKRRGTDTRATDVQRKPSPEMKQPDVERKGRTETRGTDIQRRPGTDVKPQDAEKRKGDVKTQDAERSQKPSRTTEKPTTQEKEKDQPAEPGPVRVH